MNSPQPPPRRGSRESEQRGAVATARSAGGSPTRWATYTRAVLVRRHRPLLRRLALVLGVALVAGCEAGPPAATPEPRPGTAGAPREINLITKDDEFVPKVVDLFPGETVVFHVVNGGLAIHEAVIGDVHVQDAWEEAEAATVGAPPGPTPVVSVRPELAGLRAVVQSGERVDLPWTAPADRRRSRRW